MAPHPPFCSTSAVALYCSDRIAFLRGGASHSARSTAPRRHIDHSSSSSSSSGGGVFLKDLLQNQKQLGVGLLAVGLLLTFLAIMLFFEGTLLRLGNIAIIAGVFMLIGPGRVGSFFLQKERLQATVVTSLGILLVFSGRSKLGLATEVLGLLSLFGNMFPLLLAVGKRMPIVGDLLSALFDRPQQHGPYAGVRSRGRGSDDLF